MSIPFTWIYLIHDPFTNLYKIGKSDNPEIRLKQLCNTNVTIPAAPQDYVLIEAWQAPEAMEKWLHDHFAADRVRGEWFDLSDSGDPVELVGFWLKDRVRYFAHHSYEVEWVRDERDQAIQSFCEVSAERDYYRKWFDTAILLEQVWGQKQLYPAPQNVTEKTLLIN